MYKHFQFRIVSIIHFKNLLLIHKFIPHLIITLSIVYVEIVEKDCIYYVAGLRYVAQSGVVHVRALRNCARESLQ